MKKRGFKSVSAIVAGTAISVLGASDVQANDMFECEDLGSGAELRADLMAGDHIGFISPEAKCGDATCGEKNGEKKTKEGKAEEAKCGEAKAEVKSDKSTAKKKVESKTKEHKCGDAKTENASEADPD